MTDIFGETDKTIQDSRDVIHDRDVPCKMSFRNAAALTLMVQKNIQEGLDSPGEINGLDRTRMKVQNSLKFHEDEIIMLDRIAHVIQRRLDALGDMEESKKEYS
jgi:hypothetical protein